MMGGIPTSGGRPEEPDHLRQSKVRGSQTSWMEEVQNWSVENLRIELVYQRGNKMVLREFEDLFVGEFQ